ncbi:DUF488 domain-containing protein [Parasphingorhabdus sp. DH2-15]|uniref:DUF488 domain-containing protein n=1 Tax=Parasphingorhabdus sp. DH2-15 TaxID=3444112 RepID=UPI003F6852D0
MIYTIGYSNRPLPEFTKELEQRSITRLVDVRSRPWSRSPSYNRKTIERWSEKMGIHYQFEGEALGGDCDGNRELQAVAETLTKIAHASRNENVAIMCAEGDPAKCHRTWDVSVWLLRWHEIEPVSILRDGSEESAAQSLLRVSKRNLPDHASQYLSCQRSLF